MIDKKSIIVRRSYARRRYLLILFAMTNNLTKTSDRFWRLPKALHSHESLP
ncbi:hypothetical protein [Nostoc sp. NOS(2021)]|uniref:hypothetical protein n=1 Tax=Nostoc sp. NOS(2021) TaxID=2815407 RepID=UPI0025E6E820|nr:hypothetical protein [Nostoc sp. NOS(2021)]